MLFLYYGFLDQSCVCCLCIAPTLLTSLHHWSPYNHEAIDVHSQTTDPETDWFQPAQRGRQRKWKSCIIDLWNSYTGMSPSYMQPAENYRKLKQARWQTSSIQTHLLTHLYFYSSDRRKYIIFLRHIYLTA